VLDANLTARVESLVSPAEGDPFEGLAELVHDAPVALAA